MTTMSNIYYSKERKLTFEALRIKLTNIPVLISEKLTIYQKYVILLLNEGVYAVNRDELIDKISIALNIKKSFISEFIERLSELNYLVLKDNIYHLSDNYQVIVDANDNTVMHANIGIGMADCDELYYIPALDKVYDISYFDNHNIVITKNNNAKDVNIEETKIALSNNEKELELIVQNNLEEKGYILCNELIYNIFEVLNYSFDVNITCLYEYNGEIAQMKEIGYDENLNIPKEVIDEKAKEFAIDDKLPKFIELKEKFYEKYNSNETDIEDLINREQISKKSISDLESIIESKESELQLEKKKLKNTKEDNKKEISRLSTIIEDLTNELNSTNEELKKTRVELGNVQHEKNNKKEEQETLLNINKKIMNPIINNTFGKFSKYDILNTKVNKICSHLDEAISANEYDSFDELFDSVSEARGLYGKTFKAVFDVIFNRVEEKLAVYYKPIKYQSQIDGLMNKRILQIDKVTFQNVKKMHNVFCKDAHDQDWSYDSGFTKEIFKSLSKLERYNILISIIKFLNGLNLSDNEYKLINKKLSENQKNT